MIDNLERRIQYALGEEAEGWVPEHSHEELGASLLHRGGRRRRRRAGILAGGAVVVLGAALASGLVLSAASPGGRQHLTVAGSGTSTAPTSITGVPRDSFGTGTHNDHRSSQAAPAPSTAALPGPAKAPSPTTTHGLPPASPAPTSPSGPVSPPGSASRPGQGSSTPSVVTAVPPAPAVVPPPPLIAAAPTAGEVTLTVADNASTVHLGIGQHLMVDLQGSPIDPWNQPTASNAAVLQAQPSGVAATNGSAVAQFLAASKGHSKLSSAENPRCRPACEIPSRLWTVTVIVG